MSDSRIVITAGPRHTQPAGCDVCRRSINAPPVGFIDALGTVRDVCRDCATNPDRIPETLAARAAWLRAQADGLDNLARYEFTVDERATDRLKNTSGDPWEKDPPPF